MDRQPVQGRATRRHSNSSTAGRVMYSRKAVRGGGRFSTTCALRPRSLDNPTGPGWRDIFRVIGDTGGGRLVRQAVSLDHSICSAFATHDKGRYLLYSGRPAFTRHQGTVWSRHQVSVIYERQRHYRYVRWPPTRPGQITVASFRGAGSCCCRCDGTPSL